MADPGAGDLVVLDLDGVLLQLDLQTEQVRAHLSSLLGVEPRPLLQTLEETCARVSREDPARGQALREEAWALIDAEELRAAARPRPAAGAQELLRALEGRSVALFSNNCRQAVDLALRSVGIDPGCFVEIQSRTEPRSLKPAGDPLVTVVDALEEVPPRVFVVGDHPVDMESAVMARQGLLERGVEQVIPIGLHRGDTERMDGLERAGAWFLAEDLTDVQALVTTRRAPLGLAMVLLAFNEEVLIGRAIEEARRFGEVYLERHEIIVVDDGSTDRTAQRIAEHDGADLRVVRHGRNQGMGAAMRDGYRAASLEYIAHLPGDRQLRPAALAALLPLAGPDRVVLTRFRAPPSGRSRGWVSLVFRLLVRHLGGLKVDFSGTYLFHRRFVSLLDDPRTASNTFLFSFELLQLLADAGCGVHQLEVSGLPRQAGRSRELAARRIARVFGEILRHRLATLPAQVRGARRP